MNREELVLQLTAAMLVIFEYIEVVEDRIPSAAHHFSEGMQHLGTLVEILVVEEMKETGRLIPKPRLERDTAYHEETFYEDLGRLEKFLRHASESYQEANGYWLMRAHEAVNEGVFAVLVAERQRLAPDMEMTDPWSVLNAVD